MRAVLLLSLVLPLAACTRRPPELVLLVTIDTLRADHCSAFGYDLETTPNLKALAARGTAFNRCWSQHVETGPSLASLMTSRYPRELGVRANGDVLPAPFPTLAGTLRNDGYRTAAFVSTYLLKPHASGLHRGFDHYDDEMTARNLGHDRFERPAEETVGRALAWLHRTSGRRFVWVHLYDPHGRYDPPEPLRFLRRTGRPPLDPSRIVPYQQLEGVLDPDVYVARYDGEIARADGALGPLFTAAGGEALVAVTADHGESLGEDDYWFRHGSLLNRASLHVPLVLAGPGVPRGRRSAARNLDVAPTILALLGLDSLPGARGRSLFPEDGAPRPSFAEARRRGGVRDRTGIDTGYKVSMTEGETHVVYRPGREPCPSPAIEAWLASVPERLEAENAGRDVRDALRSLGYIR